PCSPRRPGTSPSPSISPRAAAAWSNAAPGRPHPCHPTASARPVSPGGALRALALSAAPGGRSRRRPRRSTQESLLLRALLRTLLRTLWHLSYQDLHDWLVAWPTLAFACGLPGDERGHPRVPSPSQQWKRARRAGAPVAEALLVVVVRLALHRRLIG